MTSTTNLKESTMVEEYLTYKRELIIFAFARFVQFVEFLGLVWFSQPFRIQKTSSLPNTNDSPIVEECSVCSLSWSFCWNGDASGTTVFTAADKGCCIPT